MSYEMSPEISYEMSHEISHEMSNKMSHEIYYIMSHNTYEVMSQSFNKMSHDLSWNFSGILLNCTHKSSKIFSNCPPNILFQILCVLNNNFSYSWYYMGWCSNRTKCSHKYRLQDPLCRFSLTSCYHRLAQRKSYCVHR